MAVAFCLWTTIAYDRWAYTVGVRSHHRISRPFPRRTRWPKSPSLLWTALNSTLVLWLLSALFLSGAPFVYTYWNQSRAESRAAKLLTDRLDLEIAYRYSQMLTLCRNKDQMERRLAGYSRLLQVANPMDGSHFIKQRRTSSVDSRVVAVEELRAETNRLRTDIGDIPAVRHLLTSPPGAAYTTLYPEYANFSLLGLVNTLRIHTEGQDGVELGRVSDLMTRLPLKSRIEAINFIKRDLILPRWRNQFWQYESCGPSDPLCNSDYSLNSDFASVFVARNGEIIALNTDQPISDL